MYPLSATYLLISQLHKLSKSNKSSRSNESNNCQLNKQIRNPSARLAPESRLIKKIDPSQED